MMKRIILSSTLILLVGLAGCEIFPKNIDQDKVALTLESAYRETESALRASIAIAEPGSSQVKNLKKILKGMEKLRSAYLIAKDALITRKALRVQHAVPLVMAALQDDKKAAFVRAFDYLSAELSVEISASPDGQDKNDMIGLQTVLKELRNLIQ